MTTPPENSKIQMVLVDLDGTILNNKKEIGEADLITLQKLGNHGIIRVFATGRNLYSALKVLPKSTPIDYLIFSSGAGILDWKSQKLLFSSSIEKSVVDTIISALKKMDLNFSVHFPIPENHRYFYHKGNNVATDFDWRNSLYDGYNFKLNHSFPHKSATQFIVILKNLSEFQLVATEFPEMKIIRATSPIDGKSVWLEIFNTDVSKAKGGMFLCEMLNVSPKLTLGIGNDYNDLDLLDWTTYSYIVDNAPDDIKIKYSQCSDNQNNPLSFVYQKHWL